MSQEGDIANIVISATMAPPTCCLLNFMLMKGSQSEDPEPAAGGDQAQVLLC